MAAERFHPSDPVTAWLLAGDPAIRWPVGKKYSGRVFFTMEPQGPSRWNTLRALRILRWWEGT